MTLGGKLSKLRKQNHYTQEQLADMLGVSRQAVSKWESDAAYPETEKLLKLGDLYHCSMDYLLKDGEETPAASAKEVTIHLNMSYFERKSKKCIGGLPLWHINIGYGRTAKGIFAVGLSARGVVSIGLASLGIFSFGVFSLGLLALGVLAIGLFSVGSIACGVIALGAITVGVISIGALSIGDFSVGAMAIGKYFAKGDDAIARIALGDTKATGSIYQILGEYSPREMAYIQELLDANVPAYLAWAKAFIMLFL